MPQKNNLREGGFAGSASPVQDDDLAFKKEFHNVVLNGSADHLF